MRRVPAPEPEFAPDLRSNCFFAGWVTMKKADPRIGFLLAA